MSVAALMYLVSMGALFVGQRLLEGSDGAQAAVTIVGILLLALSAGLRLRRRRAAKDGGLRLGHRLALMGLLVGAASLVLYAATTDGVVTSLSLGDEVEERWLGTWRSLWPLVWLLGTVPMLAVDVACQSSPVMMPERRVRELALHGLVAAMGIGLVFPVNYIASQHKERWDLAYFKTPQPGTATVALVQALETPIDVRIFMPPSSEVAQELRNYFAPLEGPLLRVQVIDQAAEPRLANEIGVRNNGSIAFTQGEVVLDPPPVAEGEDPPPKPVTQTIRVDPDFEKAKRTLKGIDSDVQKSLISLGQGERVAYLTAGHAELTLGRLSQPNPALQASSLRDTLRSQGFSVKEFSLAEQLADGVPEDASVVFVLGPRYPFTRPETEALRSYLQSGGSLFLSLEPEARRAPLPVAVDDPLEAMVEEVLGVRMGEGVLADELNHVRYTGQALDNFLLLTSSVSSHGSTVAVASNARREPIVIPQGGFLELVEGHEAGHTVTVRSMPTAFPDLEPDGTFSADAGEEKGARALVVAVSGGSGSVGWRAIVTSTSNLVSDAVLGAASEDDRARTEPGNVQLVRDAANWLIGAEALSGTTESEKDVRIEHTKEGQTWWFYSTVLGVPLLVFAFGAVRVFLRQRGGER